MTNTSNKKIVIIAVIACLVFFYGGMKYGESTTSNASSASTATNARYGQYAGGRGAGGLRNGGGITAGQILAVDSTGLTLQLRSGGSMIVLYSTSTQVLKSVSGTASDLATGQQVMVSGTANSDGSITAQSIQIRPDVASSNASVAK